MMNKIDQSAKWTKSRKLTIYEVDYQAIVFIALSHTFEMPEFP
jgi:hypothetical protein